MFTPIDVQHAAAERHLGRREGRCRGRKGSELSEWEVHLHFTHSHAHKQTGLSHFDTKAAKQTVVFNCCVALFGKTDKGHVE